MQHNDTGSTAQEGDSEQIDFQRYMIFRIFKEFFCVNIEQLTHVSYPQRLNQVPMSKKHVMGVVSLRGELAVQVDLAEKFNLSKSRDLSNSEQDAIDCLLYVQTPNGRMAVPVHEVIGVKTVLASEVLNEFPKPAGVPHQFLKGALRMDEQLYLILDLAQSLDESDLNSISEAMNNANQPKVVNG